MTETNVLAVSIMLKRKAQEGDAFQLEVCCDLPLRGITAVFGHSGSGKTTLLRAIAGLESQTLGEIVFNGEVWQNHAAFMPVHQRNIGYVFQQPSLFTHLNAEQNLAYAKKRAKSEVSMTYYQQVINVMGIENLLEKYPEQLSGGEQQRVAITRALLGKPQLLLMDEPLASLDSARKREILPYLERLHQQLDLPIIYVSHAMDEIARLADHALVLEKGELVAKGTLNEVFSQMALPFEHQAGVVINGQITEKISKWQLAKLAFSGGELWIKDTDFSIDQLVKVQIQARDISLTKSEHNDSSILNRLPVEIKTIEHEKDSAFIMISLSLGDTILYARVTRYSLDKLMLTEGMKVWAQIKSVAIL